MCLLVTLLKKPGPNHEVQTISMEGAARNVSEVNEEQLSKVILDTICKISILSPESQGILSEQQTWSMSAIFIPYSIG